MSLAFFPSNIIVAACSPVIDTSVRVKRTRAMDIAHTEVISGTNPVSSFQSSPSATTLLRVL